MEDKLIVAGVKEKGYGEIYKHVMRDPKLPLTAKALYGVFLFLCRRGDHCFPKPGQDHGGSSPGKKYVHKIPELPVGSEVPRPPSDGCRQCV